MRQSAKAAIYSSGQEKPKYWIFNGSDGGMKISGGYGGQRYTLSSTQIKFDTIANSSSRANWYAKVAINLTNYTYMKFVVSSSSGAIQYRRGGVATSTNVTPTKYASIANKISSNTTYTVDVSSLTGNYYINFWMSPNYAANTSTTVVKQIWLE